VNAISGETTRTQNKPYLIIGITTHVGQKHASLFLPIHLYYVLSFSKL